MDRIKELQIANLQDVWTKLYFYLAKNIVEDFKIEGEKCLREGIRNFGIDRGITLRKTHISKGLKLNLFNLFTFGDLPNDPRFRRNKIKLTSQERLSETLVCPIANLWIEMGGKKLGRIYCEEFHHAKFSAYAPKSQTNLTQTITQDGDSYCRFSVYLRPANMDEEERKLSFEEFDDNFKQENIEDIKKSLFVSHKQGYEMLCIKLYFHIAAELLKVFGKEAENVLYKATKEFSEDVILFMRKKASMLNTKIDEDFLDNNLPISFKYTTNTWEKYTNKVPEQIFTKVYFTILKRCLEQ